MNRVLGVANVIARRVCGALGLLIGASAIIYLTVRAAPGNALDAIISADTSPADRAAMLKDFGLDQGPVAGFFSWLQNAVQGELGTCIGKSFQGFSVEEILVPAYGMTVALAFLSLLACFITVLILALLFGEERGGGRLSAPLYVLTSAPSFVAAVFLIQGTNIVISNYVVDAGYVPPDWFPLPGDADSFFTALFAGVTLMASDGLFMEYYNSVSAQVSRLRGSQFITAIRSKGASIAPHVAKNLLIPLLAGFAARLPLVLGGAVIVEVIFGLEGAGYVLLQAAKERDFPLVVGISVMFTATVIALGLCIDVIRAFVDPREVSRGA